MAKRRGFLLVLAAPFAILALSVALFVSHFHKHAAADDQKTALLLAQLSARIEAHVATRLNLARSLRQFWVIEGGLSEARFRSEAATFHTLYNDIQAINWTDGDGIIRWVTPRAGNEAAVGVNVMSVPPAAAALDAARASGELRITAPLQLAQGGRGFVGYIPLGDREAGYLNIVFRTAPMLANALGEDAPEGYRLRLWDGDEQIFGPSESDRPSLERAFAVGDRLWTARLAETGRPGVYTADLAILVGGVLAALMTGGFGVAMRRALMRSALNEARFRDFANASSDYFWETDANLRFSYLSPSFTRSTGLPAAALLGRTPASVDDPDGDRESLTALDRIMRAGEHFIDLRRRRDRDGERRELSISGAPAHDAEGRFIGYRGVGRDVTDAARREAEIEAARATAETANAAKSTFLATMSHELRTPLNAILGFSQLLGREPYGPLGADQYRDYVGNIAESGAHLLELVSDILDFSAAESGPAIAPEWIEARPVIETALRQVAREGADNAIRIDTAIAPEAETLFADRRALLQIAVNLLSNATKYAHPGGHVRLTLARADGAAALTVADDGVGMAPDMLDRVMEAFVTGSDPHKARGGGVGLGLAIVKTLAERHDGRIKIESAPGEGARVTVLFPDEQVAMLRAAG